MKDRRSSGAGAGVFPFSIGCMSQSSVAVAEPQEKKTQSDPSSSSSTTTTTTTTAQSSEECGGGEATTKEKTEKAATPASPGIVTAGVQRLMKGIKSLSQIFAVSDGEDDDDEEQEMVIGYPTDVQHVGHIGWDGLNKVGAVGMVNAFSSLPSSLSLRQLEVAMDQAAHA